MYVLRNPNRYCFGLGGGRSALNIVPIAVFAWNVDFVIETHASLGSSLTQMKLKAKNHHQNSVADEKTGSTEDKINLEGKKKNRQLSNHHCGYG